MEKTFSHAGVSTLNGVVKARFANDAARVKVLQKNGHKDIDLMELPYPMTKLDAVNYMLSIDFDNGNATVRQTLEAELDKRTDAPAQKKAEPVAETTETVTAEVPAEEHLEDAPY